MDFKILPFQKILLSLFVFLIFFFIGWYAEKTLENFFANSNLDYYFNI